MNPENTSPSCLECGTPLEALDDSRPAGAELIPYGEDMPDIDLSHFKEVIQKLNSGEYTLEGQINLACWLGERTHLLVSEIERLRAEKQEQEMRKDNHA